MRHWPLGDDARPAGFKPAELRPEDVLLLWLMALPFDGDAAAAARAMLAQAPPPDRDTPFVATLRRMLVELGNGDTGAYASTRRLGVGSRGGLRIGGRLEKGPSTNHAARYASRVS